MKLPIIILYVILYVGVAGSKASPYQVNTLNPPKNDLIIIFKEGRIVKVEGTKIEKSIAASGTETLQIDGSNNIIHAKGGLKGVVINGANNEVYVDKIHSVKIDGGNNTVQYQLSANKTGKPVVMLKGANNDILKAR
ncbi:DUF3060 domain-containing protein [Sphingobacterium deserti]|uniref:Uncharacterized protein n=1 Tax=Sphingobacterium deserti TaxID=1229276 RepID=A0A0B8TAG3_9SPHI|nr:DUF3060 domain-containing protein [Sphingobacterium deserti]KGE15844.1 hypothetical protein DI53_0397 [Sphingobacterium deserti]